MIGVLKIFITYTTEAMHYGRRKDGTDRRKPTAILRLVALSYISRNPPETQVSIINKYARLFFSPSCLDADSRESLPQCTD